MYPLSSCDAFRAFLPTDGGLPGPVWCWFGDVGRFVSEGAKMKETCSDTRDDLHGSRGFA